MSSFSSSPTSNSSSQSPLQSPQSLSPQPSSPLVNIHILSSSGKPIFSHSTHKPPSNSNEEVTLSALISLIISLADECSSPIQNITLKKGGKICILRRGEIYLLAHTPSFIYTYQDTDKLKKKIKHKNPNVSSTYLTLILEYLYSQILFTLTNKVHEIYRKSISYDVRTILGSTSPFVEVIEGALDSMACMYLSTGVEVMYLDNNVRRYVSSTLQSLGNTIPSTLCSFLLCKTKLITIINSTPSHTLPPIPTSDIHLLINGITTQSSLKHNDNWFPICLPNFDSNGYVYVYVFCVDAEMEVFIVFVSASGSQDDFHEFRQARVGVCERLGFSVDPIFKKKEPPLISAIQTSIDTYPTLVKHFLTQSSAYHFVYRLNVSVKGAKMRSKMKAACTLPQTLCPELSDGIPFMNGFLMRGEVWGAYQEISERLRCGIGESEMKMTQDNSNVGDEGYKTNAINFYSNSPKHPNVTYIIKNTLIYIGMFNPSESSSSPSSSPSSEIHLVFPSILGVKECIRRARWLVAELGNYKVEERLFLVDPLVFD